MTSLYLFIYLFFTNFTHFHSFPYFHNLLSKSTSKLKVIFALKKKTNGNLCIWILFFQFLSCFSKVSFFFALLLIHHICPYSSLSLSLSLETGSIWTRFYFRVDGAYYIVCLLDFLLIFVK